MSIIPNEIIQQLQNLSPTQFAWLSGYCWAKTENNNVATTAVENIATAIAPTVKPLSISVLSASQTGNTRKIANLLVERLQAQNLSVKQINIGDYKTKNLAEEDVVLLLTSTQGEGEPPEEAVSLHKFLFGKKAPKLDSVRFAVLGLGDSSYEHFCGAAVEFDQRLAELGASRLLDRQDCNLDYQATAEGWIDSIVPVLLQLNQTSQSSSTTAVPSVTASATPTSVYNKENPFPATLVTRQKITGRNSDKDVRHIEFDLSGSGLSYQAGDALGVWANNDPALVDEILTALALTGDETVVIKQQNKALRQALIEDLEITQNTPQFVKGYAEFAQLPESAVQNPQVFASQHPIVHLLNHFPAKLTAEQFVALLRPLTPRLYSIASSQAEVGDEVHLTVGVVRYQDDEIERQGCASHYLAERAEEDGAVGVFVEQNNNFRLPENSETPIIMIGAGTGIAPFRAFVQQRAADEATGKNWLIFGNPHFSEDFLYQTEWQTFAKDGYLHKYSFAWSRDQDEKIYVQDKIRENAADIWQWLQNGSHIYVCGDANKMAKDVEKALLDVIAEQGKLSVEDADEYLDELRQAKRYQRDVY
ncbi:assimilatory sulfite reductase (NADPH) flavoprotein subunit [Lonepinella sp. MS14437]|uniref:assimilatory sulfite reductase (NADPH) flavoprotein subunit n=1 Tax=Lonepinella sp. MS14437 TaxID=3003620 RepID=UPI0036DB08E4